MAKAQSFKTKLLQNGKTATGIKVSAKVVDALGSHKRPPVKVTINGHSYPSTVASMGGAYMVPVSAENRSKAGVAAGDTISVTLELDDKPRKVSVPTDLKKALAANPAAKEFFESISYSKQQRFTLSIEGAKTAETRERRIKKAIADLKAGIA